MVIVEKSFPRGGKIETKETSTESLKSTKQIFGAVQRKVKKTKSKSTTSSENTDEELKPRSAELLTYDTIQDGMVVMAMVKSVDQLYLNVSLPGRISARISALEISDAYTKSVKEFLENSAQSEGYKPLKELYCKDKIVYGRIKEVKKAENGRFQVDMTLKPSEVHAELIHNNIKKGFIFNGAVEEVQEHGYIIESGIKGLRCFVPLGKSTAGHAVGEIIYLKVEKMAADKTVSTCICKEVRIDKLKIKDQNDPNLDYLLPSTIVNFQINKILKNGLQGSIMNETFTAYVNEHQLSESLFLPEDYEVNSKHEARILYVMPLTKFVYLTLNLRTDVTTNTEEEDDEGNCKKSLLSRGDVVENAKVHHLGTGGVILILNNKFKGIISFKTIKANYKGNYDQDELLAKYTQKSKHTVRIIDYDAMDSMYICTDDFKTVNEKYFSLNDIKPGDFVTADVKEMNHKVGGYSLQLGKLNAIIEKLFLAPSARNLEPNTKLKCRIVDVNCDRKIVYLTNRSEYMSKTSKPLLSLEEAKINGNYLGTVVKSDNNFALVKFFGNVKGIFYKQNALDGQLESLEEGLTIQFRVSSKKDDQLILGIVENAFKLGEICPVTVVHTLDSGLEINISYSANDDDDDILHKGLIPIRLLSDHIDLLQAKLHIYPVGEQLKAVCVSGTIFSLRDVKYFTDHLTCDWKSLKIGDILKSYVKDVNDEVVELVVPIRGYDKTVKLHMNMMLMNSFCGNSIELSPDQIVYVKVLGKEGTTRTITVSAKLTDVWDSKFSTTGAIMESYLTEISDIKKSLQKQGHAIARYSPGDKVTAKFQCVNEITNDWQYVVDKTEVMGIVTSSIVGKSKPPKEGTDQPCVVLWVDYSNMLVILSNKSGDLDHISTDKEIPSNLVGKSGINAKVLYKNESVFACSLKKGKHPLVFCPTKLHFNDFERTASKSVEENQFCKLTFIHGSQPIAVLDDVHKLWQNINRKRKIIKDELAEEVEQKKQKFEKHKLAEKTKKEKLENLIKSKKQLEENKVKERKRTSSETVTITKKSKTTDNEIADDDYVSDTEPKEDSILFYEDKAPDKEAAAKVIEVTSTFKSTDKNSQKPIIKSLTGVNDFWNLDCSNLSKNDESSDDDDDTEIKDDKDSTKKKLTAAEKFKKQCEEEARLRAIEEKYADPNQLPDSVDQYDRLVLSDPNNSKNWINYMVFHLQSTEIDKAKAVARRALKTINFRNSDEQINIWVALLNLELRYGTKESFNETLKEALMYNEPLKIYLRTVEIITDAQKSSELIEIIGNITKKFKTEPEVWRVSANAFFTIGMTERAQQLLHKALACLPDREHVNTIVAFANLNHRHSNNEMAQTLLDQVVTSYPKRVDVWCQYVDMLIKEDLIDSARNILERAVVQNIPLRKMRTIFKKYLEFEERFGNDVNVQRVKQLAMDYVKKSENL